MKKEEKFSQPASVKVEEAVTTHQHGIFTIIENKEKFMVAIQRYLVSSKKFKTLQEAKTYCNSKPWELIVNVTCLTVKLMQENEESK